MAAWLWLLRAACLLVARVPPASAQFAVSVNPIPLAALHISYQSALNEWEFVDRFALPYDRMAVLLCAAPATSACDLADVHFTGTCAELAAHPVLASSAWRSVGASPDECLPAPVLNASLRSGLRSVPPNALRLANNFTALRRFDTAQAHAAHADAGNGSAGTGGIELRVRFVHLQSLGRDAVHVRSSGYSLVMAPLQDAPSGVHVQSECGARGFSAPNTALPPALGGAVLEVYLATVAGRAERLCLWHCELPYTKMPWNAPALSAARPSTTGQCKLTPASFTAVGLSFVVRYPANESLRVDSQQLLFGLDRMAEDMAASLSPRFGELSVLLSMRNSSANPREVHAVSGWVRAFSARDGFDFEARDNADFSLQAAPQLRRRLLAQDSSAFVVDGLVVSGRTDDAACCMADAAVAAQQSLEMSVYDFDIPVSSLDTPQISTVIFVTQNSHHQTQVMAPPPSEESASFAPLFILLVVLAVLVCVCLCQKDGFQKNETQDTESL